MYGAISVVFCLPLFERPMGLGGNDWDQHLFYYAAVLKDIVEYGQAPFWNPWYCGGNVLWQNPQVGLLSPVYPLALIMPLQAAMKVNIVLHYWIGFVGMHVLLTRSIGLTFLPTVIYLSTLVTAAGAPAIHLAVGHSVFLPGFYLPVQIHFLFRALQGGAIRYALMASALLALMVFNGGVHILPLAFASIGIFALLSAIGTRQWRPLVITLVFVAAGLAYAAPKLLPVSLFVTGERFWDTRNPTEHPDRMTLEMVARTYLDPTQGLRLTLDQQRHGWHEYGNYIGVFSAVLIVGGLLVALWGRGQTEAWFGRSLALTAIVLFLLSLGEFATWAPASLATHLPLFSSFRIPSRYSIAFLLFAAMALAWTFRVFALETRGWPIRWAVAIVCLAAAMQIVSVNRGLLKGVFLGEPFDTTFHWMRGPHEVTTDTQTSAYGRGSPMLRSVMNDRPFFYCYESLQLFRTATDAKDMVFTDGKSQLVDTRFTPNQLDFSVMGGAEASRVFLNYNWGPGWSSTAGALDASSREVMASVLLAPGQTGRFSFSFTPPGLGAGTAVFVVALVLSAWLWRWEA